MVRRVGDPRYLSDEAVELMDKARDEKAEFGHSMKFKILRSRIRAKRRKDKVAFMKKQAAKFQKTDPARWQSELASCMELKYKDGSSDFSIVEELKDHDNEKKMSILLDHFAKTGNQHSPLMHQRLPATATFVVDVEDVKKLIKKEKEKKGRHHDNMDFRILQHCADQITVWWTFIFNLAVFYQKVPQSWKKEIVTIIPTVLYL